MAEAMFAKAGRGYDRAQVDAFLLELNRTHAEKEAAWEDKQRELEAALAEAQDALKKSEGSRTEQEEALRAALEAKERECEAMQASIGQRMLAADARAEEIVAEAERQAAELMEKEQRRAEEIVAEAEREAAELQASERSRVEQETAQMLEEVRAKCAVIGQAADMFAKRIGDISVDLHGTERALNDAMEEARRQALGNA